MHGIATFRWMPLFAAALLYLGLPGPASAEEASDARTEENVPHIALILPTKAKSLAAPAEVVRQGAMTAELKLGDDNTPKLRLYPTGERDEEALIAYRQAVARGAVGVIGPLTRGSIAKLAAYGRLEVPVLALNSLDGLNAASAPANLFALGLSIEAEARQIARAMQRDGCRQPVVVESSGPLARRMRDAFSKEWQLITGKAPMILALGADKEAVWKLKDKVAALNADALFLAADQKKARLVRPYLGSARPLYATSQVWGGKFGKVGGTNVDLVGVKFVDMPWLLEPYQGDVLAFKRADKPLNPDMQRLYALGIDAYRLSLLLLVSAPGAAIEVQGVTGTLRLSESRQFSRELMSGEVGGVPRTPAPPKQEAPPPAPAAAPAEPGSAKPQGY
ncbi:penicillin-binding protein activator [Chitinimonas arctica]|uniref:Penicillin-binding protein activator n=1 Tax=Chitinimonas arctica TaxID=2594795 RepID=A0A516S9R9_9NEIS|nr:penicillin-binding protein activator [Chitinimonas arctica]QDQ24899.1 penicillin-binding protein activator [Chitinimonas arctica]